MEMADPPIIGKCVALHDFSAEHPVELSFVQNDVILLFDKDESGELCGWWDGKNQRTGEVGLIPVEGWVRELEYTRPPRPPPSSSKPFASSPKTNGGSDNLRSKLTSSSGDVSAPVLVRRQSFSNRSQEDLIKMLKEANAVNQDECKGGKKKKGGSFKGTSRIKSPKSTAPAASNGAIVAPASVSSPIATNDAPDLGPKNVVSTPQLVSRAADTDDELLAMIRREASLLHNQEGTSATQQEVAGGSTATRPPFSELVFIGMIEEEKKKKKGKSSTERNFAWGEFRLSIHASETKYITAEPTAAKRPPFEIHGWTTDVTKMKKQNFTLKDKKAWKMGSRHFVKATHIGQDYYISLETFDHLKRLLASY